MLIQWYPGHMHKAGKDIKAILPEVDLVIEVLDARIPFSSQNPLLATLRGDKPCIKILNKCDLADPDATAAWQQYLETDLATKTLAVSSDQPEKTRQLPALAHKLLPNKAAGDKLITALIMGIPNVGKSTVINILAGRAIAKTGNEPAITKMQQRIAIAIGNGNGIVLLDTPGMLWPNVENANSGFRLAATGAIKDTAFQHHDIAYFVAEFFLQHYFDSIRIRYNLTQQPESASQLLAMIGRLRGCLRPGGVIDEDKTAKLLLNDLRSGLLGRITLESPAMMAQELADLAVLRADKAAKKKARQQKFKTSKFK